MPVTRDRAIPSANERVPSQSAVRVHVGVWLCLGGAAIGAVGLMAWLSGTPGLTTIAPGLPPMTPNTALALLLIGGAGAARQQDYRGCARWALAQLAAGAGLALAVGTLVESALDIELPILAIGEALARNEATLPPGRSAPFPVIALTLLAAAILILDVRRSARVRPSELLVACAAIIAFTGLTGIILGAPPLDRLTRTPLFGVSLGTAVSVLLTSIGLLARPDAPGVLMRLASAPGPGGSLFRRWALPLIVVPILLGFGATRLAELRGVADIAVPVALLAATMAVVSLALLGVMALPLNRVHAAVEASRTHIRELVEHAPDGIFVADLDGRYTDVNEAGCRLLGYSREQIVGKTIVDLIPPGEDERLWRERELLLRGVVQVTEWTLRRKDGSYVPVEVSAKILSDGRWQGFVRDISERKRLEREAETALEQLRESEGRFRLAFDDAPIGMALVALDGRFFRVNRALCEIVGYSREELTGLTFQAITHRDDLAADLALSAQLTSGDIPRYQLEKRYIRKDGVVVDVMLTGSMLRGPAAEASYYIAHVEDITARKRLTEDLRLSEAKSTGILAISADAIVSIDEQQRITQFNEGAEKLFGYSRTEILGAPLDILIPQQLRRVHASHVAAFADAPAVARKMGSGDAAIVGRRKNGEEFLADAAISKLDVGGARVLTAAVRDITEQKRTENEQRLLAEVGAVLTTTLDYSETAERVAGIAVQSFSDWCIVDLVDGSGGAGRLSVGRRSPDRAGDAVHWTSRDQKCPRFIQSVLESRQPRVLERPSADDLEAIARDGAQFRALCAIDLQAVMVIPLIARGRVLGAISFFWVAPHPAEPHANLRIAQVIAERAALAVDNARLYHEAQRATQMRDDVLGIVAHDLRNPLSMIQIEAGLLGRRDDEPERRTQQPGQRIERAANRMNRLIQDLVDVTRMEAGQLALELHHLSAAQVAVDAVEDQKGLAAARSLELRLDLRPELPEVHADRDRLLQVFGNLIGNAIDFTPAGGCITVGAVRQDARVLFWVRDTGPGIAAENQPHVFDRFWQARNTKRAGAGLGLPIVKGIVEGHGGRAWVESAPGAGSTFFFTIPIAGVPRAAV